MNRELLKEQPMTPTRYQESQKVTWVSVFVNIGLVIAQVWVGIIANAQSLVADGLHSFSDMVCDFVVLLANAQSRHPADGEHPYGHYRIETAASLTLGLLLAITGIAILWAGVERLQHLDDLPPIHPIAMWATLITLLAKEGLFRYMLHVGEKLRSPMLIANAWHARSDAASSLVVAVGIGGSLLGYRFLDPVAAIVIGYLILRMGVMFTHDAMRELVDTGLSKEEVTRIRATLMATAGVVDLHELRTRRMAHQVLVDAHIKVDPRISVSEGHHIAETARKQLLAAHPEVMDVLAHVDVEDDFGPDASMVDLPDRETLLNHLRKLLGSELDVALPLFEKTTLHYLGNRVEAEIFLTRDICLDTAKALRLQHALAARLVNDPYFSAVSLNCRVES